MRTRITSLSPAGAGLLVVLLAVFGLLWLDSTAAKADPVIAAAGDIACAPSDSSFNGGAGEATHCRQLYTSNLLGNQGLAAVLPLGDLQYDSGALSDFRA